MILNTRTDTLTNKSTSASGLQSQIKYSAEDSIRFDHVNNVVYLYGKGRIVYDDFELDADYIRLDQKNNIAFARGYTDPKNNRYRGRPILKQGSEAPITTDSLVFNYTTKKGKSYGVFSDVDGGYLQAKQFKKNQFDEGFFKNGIYSTCNQPHPHFGIHITRGIVTDKQIVTGPAYLEVEDVPLPLGVPFGFFPKPNRRSGGLLFPSFGEDNLRGFFMRDLGYYFGLSDYWDLAIRGSLYSKGSYEGNTQARYRKNYKYDGQFSLRYASSKNGVEGTPAFENPAKDFNITWNHSQRPEANPGTTFSASVNAGTGSYFANTAAGGTYNFDQLTRNTLSSNISYGKVFGNGLFNFTSSLSHRQDLETSTVFLELPTFSLNMSTINPFDSKDRVGEQKWFQKVNVGYSLQGSNSISTTEDQLFNKDALQKFNNGFQHNIPVSLSLNLLKYFQFNSGLQYNERWYLQTIRKNYIPNALDSVVTDTVPGFSRAYEYSLNTGLSTKLYGQLNFKKGKFAAIRHVATPSVSFNYRPDFGSERFGYYRDLKIGDQTERYSIYENRLYGSPTIGKTAGIGFSIDNTIEAKRRASKDTTSTNPVSDKIPILQNLSFSGNYNFAVDSFQLSSIGFSGRTSLFKQKVGINFNGSFDPYSIDETGRRLNQFSINSGKIARLTNFGLSFDFSLNSDAMKKRNENLNQLGQNSQNINPQQAQELAAISRDPNAFVDFNIPWNISASYSFQYSKFALQSSITNTLNFYGDFNVTPKWKVQYTSGYDFQQNKLSLTQFSIYRDLHCWDMSFRWIPIGPYRSYSVDIKVRASVLQDLKLSRRRDYFNNF
ncbi:putative LPS assembly protein LptD [Daejeonella oryzae]|uniref:putative LPS assembly protein LptD n=1 Tax=Daejeonella oryzae TaxID=1122943 RepID=UPI001FDEB70A|nr:putative LPS assembly protein LptD [Daejeonella oryzae]